MGKGNTIGITNDPTIIVASGVWDLREHLIAVKTTAWPSIGVGNLYGGGSTTTDGAITVETFTTSGTLTVQNGPAVVDYLIVGGGGGGGDRHGGGGGGGGVLSGTMELTNGTYSVTVGPGGAGGDFEGTALTPDGVGVDGSNSVVVGIGTAFGGGTGGTYDGMPSAIDVGSGGGGGGQNLTGNAGTIGQGNSGGDGLNPGGGGGGGAGGVGGNADSGDGGVGIEWPAGSGIFYGGGGGGAMATSASFTSGGNGGGGAGGWDGAIPSGGAGAGGANTGGGGGGQRSFDTSLSDGGAGGSGVVIFRYSAGVISDINTTDLLLNYDAANFTSYPSSGATWADLSVNANDGTLVGGPTYTTDNGGVLDFNGTSYFTTGIHPGDPNTSFTFGCWIRVDTLPIGTDWFALSNYVDASHNGFYAIAINNSGADCFLWFRDVPSAVSVTTTSTAVSAATWYEMVGVRDHVNNEIRFYINGSLIDTQTFSGSLDVNDPTGFFGGLQHAGANTLDADLSKVYVYSRALNTSEILDNHNAIKARYGL